MIIPLKKAIKILTEAELITHCGHVVTFKKGRDDLALILQGENGYTINFFASENPNLVAMKNSIMLHKTNPDRIVVIKVYAPVDLES